MPSQVKMDKSCLMDKTLELTAGRPGVRIPGRGKCSLRTICSWCEGKLPTLLFYKKYKIEENIFGDPITDGKFQIARLNELLKWKENYLEI